jgi:aspartyl-tRNA(Asn)/glutamyl-tRNA(Gln) amidotransferase subunit A
MDAIAGPDASDPDSADHPYAPPPFDGSLEGVRIGVVREHHFPDGHDPAVGPAFDAALDVLAARGAILVDLTLPYWYEMLLARGAHGHRRRPRPGPARPPGRPRRGGPPFDDVDVIACPTTSTGAPQYDDLVSPERPIDIQELFRDIHMQYWDLGQTAAGLPLSIQFAGPALGEAGILRTADAYQAATDWHLRVPSTL